jgi:uncharacterized membrane-anchored protein
VLTASSEEMRPSGVTAVASMHIAPTPLVENPCILSQLYHLVLHQTMITHSNVDEMPVGGMPVVGAILTHGRLNTYQGTVHDGLSLYGLTTKILLGNVTPLIVRGWKSFGISCRSSYGNAR